ncbi:LEM3/CDC50 family protein, putative [Hepatocystis sp. ex Piliocolobus tephrosceles]|nr:LEM3/CDC50 family protein, putative [Hepatocystis sp. ex Piliocolobus tephrosceles]
MDKKMKSGKLYKKKKIYYKRGSKIVHYLHRFIQWYKMENVVGHVWIYGYLSIIKFLLLLFFINFIIGIIIIYLSTLYIECRIPYEYKTYSYNKYSIVKVTPDHCKGYEDLKMLNGEINIHYEIYGIHQNHNAFITSFKKDQLNGQVFLNKKDLKECSPLITYEHDGVDKILHPCGILQWNVFTDSYTFYDKEPETMPIKGSLRLKQRVEDITIKYYRQFFKNPNFNLVNLYKKDVYFWMDKKIQSNLLNQKIYINEKLVILAQMLKYRLAGRAIENSHFINWMIPSAFNYVKRLYAKLDGPLTFPFYIYIENNYKITNTKIIVISTTDFYLNTFLIGIIFIIVAIFALFIAILYFIRMKKQQAIKEQLFMCEQE